MYIYGYMYMYSVLVCALIHTCGYYSTAPLFFYPISISMDVRINCAIQYNTLEETHVGNVGLRYSNINHRLKTVIHSPMATSPKKKKKKPSDASDAP